MIDDPVTQQKTNLFLILEKKDGTAIRQILYEQVDVPHWIPLFAETVWAPYMDETPLLIQVSPEMPFYQWARSAMAEENGLRGLLIESEHALAAVADWSRKRLTVSFDGNRTGLLRFYDPQVWQTLATAQGKDDFPIARVHYWLDGWQTSENPEIATPS